MLELFISGGELYNEKTNEFQTTDTDDIFLTLEHSLVSLSKWEALYQKPFLDASEKTRDETFAYIECMIVDEDYPEDVCDLLTSQHLKTINEYIDSPSTATTFSDFGRNKKIIPQIITSELVYYWMIVHNIPFECQHWHLNKLFALIRLCNIKNDPKPKKLSPREVAERNTALNEARKKQLGTTG